MKTEPYSPQPQLVMTTTNELFLPSRIVYRVFDPARLLRRFEELRSMVFETPKRRWSWNYEFEAKRLGWPDEYERIPPERQPLLLASCYLIGSDAMHVYVRSTLRLQKALDFFDRHIPRRCAKGDFFDEYNLVTTRVPGQPLPGPEDFFQDESRFVLQDPDAMFKGGRSLDEVIELERSKTLAAFERHSLEAFYEDGPAHMETAMRLRGILALKQHQSPTPIHPLDICRELFSESGGLDSARSSQPPQSVPPTQSILIEHPATEIKSLSFVEPDSFGGQQSVVLDFPEGKRRFALEFSACRNPMCDCRKLDVSLRSTDKRENPESKLRIIFEKKKTMVEHAQGDGAVTEALVRRFSEDDWLALVCLFFKLKADCSEITDASAVQVRFPEKILADPSCLLAYKEVFRWSVDLRFSVNGSTWTALERYCTNPGCGCVKVLLDFVPIPATTAARPKRTSSQDATMVFLDFRTGAWRVEQEGPRGFPPPQELIAAWQAACPNWQSRIERRHRVLRQLHQRARGASRSGPTPSGPAPEPRKSGRNERCPCGSGKKYKHCCGR